MRTIRWGIIGCGDVTEVKSGPGFRKAENSQLIAVMRRNGALAKDYAERHGVRKWYDDAHALVDDPEVDAVYVATPPGSHKEYAVMSARAGKPVYVEKPMALNYAECMEMVNACEAARVPLFVAYYRRCLPRFIKIKSLIDEGAIGAVRAVHTTLYRRASARDEDPTANWRIDPAIAGGGYFVDMAAHSINFLEYALGKIEEVSGQAANQAGLYKAEDIVCGSFRFAGGAQGTGLWCFSAFAQKDYTEIIGSAGRIEYATFDESPIVLTTRDGTQSFNLPNPPHVHQPLIQSIVDALNGQGSCPSDGPSGAHTTWVMDKLLNGYHA